MSVVFTLLAFVFLAAGVVGSVLPVLPGPPLAYLALIFVSFAEGWSEFSVAFLITMGAIAVAVTVSDYILPNVVSRKRGASRAGAFGSVVGMLVGMLVFPPFGLFIGAFVGAVLGELLFGEDRRNALRAGWGVFLGSFLSMVLKLCYAGIVGYFAVRAVVL